MTDPTRPDHELVSAGGIRPDAVAVADPALVEEQTNTEVPPGESRAPRSLWTDAWLDLRHNPYFIVAAVMILLLLLVAIVPGLFTSNDPTQCTLSNSRKGPTSGHPFGFTLQGCDVYARTIYGARASITVGVFVTVAASLLGGTVGVMAGYFGGWIDSILSRITDIFYALPLLLGAIVFLSAFPNRNVWTVVGALAVLGWTQIARISRGAVIEVKEADYVVAARALGASSRRIIMRHVLPNAIAPIIVVATISLGIYIVAEATLSFLGIGLPPNVISWGNDISSAQPYVRVAPHMLLFPAGALSIAVLTFIMLGDAVRDALDPKLR